MLLTVLLPLLAASCNKPAEVQYDSLEGLLINEVSPSKLLAGESWFELLNQTSHDISVNGMKVLLTDNRGIEDPVATVSGITVPAKGYYVISSKDFKYSRDMLRSTMEEIGIQDVNGSLINSFSTKYDFGSTLKPEDGESYARVPDGGSTWEITNVPTPGERNYKIDRHKLFSLVINEVCPGEKWVELANTYHSPQDLGFSTFSTSEGEVIYTFAEKTYVEAGSKIVASFDFDPSSKLIFKDNIGNKVAEFNPSSLGEVPQGGSWSRLPDITGDFAVSSTPTKGETNRDVTSDEKGIVINEVSLNGGWIEIANSTFATISTSDIKIYGKAGSAETKLLSAGAIEFGPCAKVSFDVTVTQYDGFILKSSSGQVLDTFSRSEIRDNTPQTPSSSWCRIPDMHGNWYTVITPSRGGDNMGITSDNAVAMWLNYSSMDTIDLDETVKLGIGNLILHEYAFSKKGRSAVDKFIEEAHRRGIKVHIWQQCFWWNDEIKWRSAVIDRVGDTPARYNQEEFTDIIGRAAGYLDSDIDGLHLDYVRFGGTGGKHNWPDDGITAIGAINEFCRQFSTAARSKKPSVILSAALMGETGAQGSYGQEPRDMARYLDILMPMAYISSYNYSDSRNIAVANWFKERAAGNALVWHGISTYDGNSKGLSASQILHDCTNITGSEADGIALFRYGIGTLPDLNALFRK